ncbi:MAG: ubiquinone biosynthesis regulatory protein kinase UbiB, partial [Methylophilaceae bacterium]
MALFRLLKIIFVALHYRLDELVLQHAKLLWLKRLLGYALRWRKQQRSRGENLRLALESLGPIFVKFGQMLSTRRD